MLLVKLILPGISQIFIKLLILKFHYKSVQIRPAVFHMQRLV